MVIIKKKNVLQELAVCLFLTLEFNPDTTADSVIQRIKERSRSVLKDAAIYTGVLGEKDLRAFLVAKPYRFNIDCGNDIVKGDTIRFTEQVFNNKTKPQRQLGLRGIVAQVMDISTLCGKPMLHLRVISSGGVWELKPDTEIRRTLRVVTRMDVMRSAWDNESQRNKPDSETDQTPKQIKSAKT